MIIAIDLGGTFIKIGLIENGQVVSYATINNLYSPDDFKSIEKTIVGLCAKHKIELDSIESMGIALPGIVDVKAKRVSYVYGKNIYTMQFDFQAWAKTKFNLPIVVENDARAAVIGEWRYGVGRGYQNIVMITLGTGIGVGVVIEGRVLHGSHYKAGILGGHLIINVDGHPCNCGNDGCLEAEIGAWNLETILRESSLFPRSQLSHYEKHNYKNIFQCYDKKDELAVLMINRLIKYLQAGTLNLVHAYDPGVVILAGGVMARADLIVKPIERFLSTNVWKPRIKTGIPVIAATDINFAALKGLEHLTQIS